MAHERCVKLEQELLNLKSDIQKIFSRVSLLCETIKDVFEKENVEVPSYIYEKLTQKINKSLHESIVGETFKKTETLDEIPHDRLRDMVRDISKERGIG